MEEPTTSTTPERADNSEGGVGSAAGGATTLQVATSQSAQEMPVQGDFVVQGRRLFGDSAVKQAFFKQPRGAAAPFTWTVYAVDFGEFDEEDSQSHRVRRSDGRKMWFDPHELG